MTIPENIKPRLAHFDVRLKEELEKSESEQTKNMQALVKRVLQDDCSPEVKLDLIKNLDLYILNHKKSLKDLLSDSDIKASLIYLSTLGSSKNEVQAQLAKLFIKLSVEGASEEDLEAFLMAFIKILSYQDPVSKRNLFEMSIMLGNSNASKVLSKVSSQVEIERAFRFSLKENLPFSIQLAKFNSFLAPELLNEMVKQKRWDIVTLAIKEKIFPTEFKYKNQDLVEILTKELKNPDARAALIELFNQYSHLKFQTNQNDETLIFKAISEKNFELFKICVEVGFDLQVRSLKNHLNVFDLVLKTKDVKWIEQLNWIKFSFEDLNWNIRVQIFKNASNVFKANLFDDHNYFIYHLADYFIQIKAWRPLKELFISKVFSENFLSRETSDKKSFQILLEKKLQKENLNLVNFFNHICTYKKSESYRGNELLNRAYVDLFKEFPAQIYEENKHDGSFFSAILKDDEAFELFKKSFKIFHYQQLDSGQFGYYFLKGVIELKDPILLERTFSFFKKEEQIDLVKQLCAQKLLSLKEASLISGFIEKNQWGNLFEIRDVKLEHSFLVSLLPYFEKVKAYNQIANIIQNVGIGHKVISDKPLLYWVILSGDLDLLKQLGIKEKVEDVQGHGPLYWALSKNDKKMVSYLLENEFRLVLKEVPFSDSFDIKALKSVYQELQKAGTRLFDQDEQFDYKLALFICGEEAEFDSLNYEIMKEKIKAFLKSASSQSEMAVREIEPVDYEGNVYSDLKEAFKNYINEVAIELKKNPALYLDIDGQIMTIETMKENFEYWIALVEKRRNITGVIPEKKEETYEPIERIFKYFAHKINLKDPLSDDQKTVLFLIARIPKKYCIDPFKKACSQIYNFAKGSSEQFMEISDPREIFKRKFYDLLSDCRDAALNRVYTFGKEVLDTHAQNWILKYFGPEIGLSFDGEDIFIDSGGKELLGNFLNVVSAKKIMLEKLRNIFWKNYLGRAYLSFENFLMNQLENHSSDLIDYYEYLVDLKKEALLKNVTDSGERKIIERQAKGEKDFLLSEEYFDSEETKLTAKGYFLIYSLIINYEEVK